MSTVNTLDALTFPLHGSRLIEASAGTGKTFTLALLYVRLVLGHGAPGTAHPRPLLPEEILVVTFTKAATKELRERIRARLVEAAALFSETPDATMTTAPASADRDPLLALRDSTAPKDWPACALRLRQAADAMDEAAIFTIHGWCQRMLQEHAFATRGLFERELTPDQADLFAELLRDYWRQTFYPLSADAAKCVQAAVTSPDALRAKLSDWLKQRDTDLSYAGEVLTPPDLDKVLQQAIARHQEEQEREAQAAQQAESLRQLENAARAEWRQDQEALEAYLRDIRPHLNGSTHGSAKPEAFDKLLAEIAAWANDEQTKAPSKLARFAAGRFNFRQTASVQEAKSHPAFDALADWQKAVQEARPPAAANNADADPQAQVPDLAAQIMAHAAAWMRKELPRRLAQRAEMGFDELLLDLDAALTPAMEPAVDATAEGLPGDQAHALAAIIRQQFPAALIDEFQDTDPVQYRIFDRVYRVADNHSGTLLTMIGDPKQAIYSFRGADIHTYLKARQAVDGRIYRLDRNYRSTQSMVAACNRLFEYAESQHPRGAFRFRQQETQDNQGIKDNPVPFDRVRAKGRDERLLIHGQESPALTFWELDTDGEPINKKTYLSEMADRAASELCRWLDRPDAQRTGFIHGDTQAFKPLQPRDIAILVRDGDQADAMYKALAARGIASVYLSERNSVFESVEAHDLVHWLRACAEPTNEGLIRNALATTTYGLSPKALAEELNDEAQWEERVERFRGYRKLWRMRGVLAMLRALLHEAELPARLLAEPRGERALTNLLHLAEWLQQAAERLDGEQALIRHLVEHLDQKDESTTVRLESDAERVQIITIHKSKGLEYPLVLLPFVCTWRPVDGRTRQVIYQQEGQRLREIAGSNVFEAAWAQADDDRLSEDMRLLYVAATRAKFGLWLGVGLLKHGNRRASNMHQGAMGYLLAGGAPLGDAKNLKALLGRVCSGQPESQPESALRLEPAPAIDSLRLPIGPDARLADARKPTHQPFARWWIASYSALRFRTGAETSSEATALEEAEPPPVPTNAALPGEQDLPMRPGENLDLEQSLSKENSVQQDLAQQALTQETEVQDVQTERTAADPATSLHDLPRGSTYGTFLHGLLEWAAEQQHRVNGQSLRGYQAAVAADHARRDTLARRCQLRGLTPWIDRLDAWLCSYLQQPLRLQGLEDAQGLTPELRLADLSPRQMQVEMEFWIESRGVEAERLDRLVRAHCLPGRPRATAEPAQLNGMLKGFIDLVFEYGGRYYVLDWKSNWLGEDDGAYTREAMTEAVLHHRYDLQYALYLLALHRQLQARLPDYDYDRHMGGAVYAFLRGHQASTAGLFTERPPRALIEGLDALFAATEAANPREAA